MAFQFDDDEDTKGQTWTSLTTYLVTWMEKLSHPPLFQKVETGCNCERVEEQAHDRWAEVQGGQQAQDG